MCYHASNSQKTSKKMEEEFRRKTKYPELYKPFYHLTGFDHPQIMGLVQNDSEIVPMTWGIVPPRTLNIEAYWKEFGGKCLNTKSEFVFDNIRTSTGIMENRVVVPVTGFFEPHDRGDVKYPCYIHPKETTYISLLGCATRFDDMILFTVLTTIANPFMAEIHNKAKRMPIMGSPELAEHWLNPNLTEKDINDIIHYDNTPVLESHPVMKSVTNTRRNTDTPEALKKHDYPVQGSLF